MTRYLIQSGNVKEYPEKMIAYFADLFTSVKDDPIVLWCFFATEPSQRDARYINHRNIFVEYFPTHIKPTHVNAEPEQFAEQCAHADVILIQGGRINLLLEATTNFDLEILFANKVVTGSSAGAGLLASGYYSCDRRDCFLGGSVLPIKVMPHYNSDYGADDPRGPIDWEVAKEELQAYGDPELPLHALEEGDYIVIET